MKTVAIVVLYNDNTEEAASNVKVIAQQVDKICLVDNSTDAYPERFSDIHNVVYLPQYGNKGIATAQNIALRYALAEKAEFIFFADPDSKIPDHAVSTLFSTYHRLVEKGYPVGGVGSTAYNRSTGSPYPLQSNFVRHIEEDHVTEVTFLMNSVSLIPARHFMQVGLMDDSLFIDGIDSEWRYTRSNELNYARLAPGDYTLHIKSTNGDGVWTDNEQTIILHRSAHFNETPWAWMLYGLLITCFVIGGLSAIRYVRRLKRELKNVQLTSKEQIELLGERIKELLPINEEVKEIAEESDTLSPDDSLFASRVKEYVANNIDNADLSVIDIAQAMYVSRTVLFVRMKHIFNSSPNNYVLNTRINYAKKLLLTTDMRVSDVAYKSGFSDPKYFSRCFKKLTGVLPKEFAEGKK